MRILFATYPKPEAFLESLYIEAGGGTLLAFATKAEFEDGEPMILEIGYPGLPNRILIRCAAAQPPADVERSSDKKWFRFDDSEELQRDFLIAVASGRAEASLQRRHRRIPMRMPVKVKIEGDDSHGDAETADMGTGGVALKTSEPLPDGARVTVVLAAPDDGSNEIEISGQVVWNRQDDDTVEVGIQFDKTGSEAMKRLRHLIRGVKVSGETLE